MASKKKTYKGIDIKNLEKLSKKDREFIKKLFFECLGSKKIEEDDLKNLPRSLCLKYDEKTINSILLIINPNVRIIENKELNMKTHKELIAFLEELQMLYGYKILNFFINHNWPRALRRIMARTSIEPEEKTSIHHLRFVRNDGEILILDQPIDVTITLTKGLLSCLNASFKELINAKINFKTKSIEFEKLEKQLSELNRQLKKIK